MFSALLDRVLGGRLRERQSALKTVAKLAATEAAGKASDADAEKLDAALRRAGIGETAYAELLDLHRRHGEMQAAVAAHPAGKAADAARAASLAVEKHRAKWREFEAQWLADLHKLQEAEGLAGGLERQARALEASLGALEHEHAAELGLDAADLDACTLKLAGASGDTLEHSDDAPVVWLPFPQFQEQRRRRHLLLEKFNAEQNEAHGLAMERYAAALAARRRPALAIDGFGIEQQVQAPARSLLPEPKRPERPAPLRWCDIAGKVRGVATPEPKAFQHGIKGRP